MTLLSTYCVSDLYASYVAVEQAGDSASVAKFSVKGEGILSQMIEAELYPGMGTEAELVIHNDSEVTVEYTIAVTNESDNLPLQLRIQKNDSTLADGPASDVVITDQPIPGRHTDNYTLHIDWSADQDDPTRMGKVDYIMVTVTAAQID